MENPTLVFEEGEDIEEGQVDDKMDTVWVPYVLLYLYHRNDTL